VDCGDGGDEEISYGRGVDLDEDVLVDLVKVVLLEEVVRGLVQLDEHGSTHCAISKMNVCTVEGGTSSFESVTAVAIFPSCNIPHCCAPIFLCISAIY
jgi:hypothetical protein